MRLVPIILALTAAPVAASAAPYVAIDSTATSLMFIDDGSVARSGTTVTLDLVAVLAQGRPMIISLRMDCTARTWQQMGNRYVEADGSIGPLLAAKGPPDAARPGTFADSALQRVCFGAAPKPGSWSAPTLAQAIKDGKSAISPTASH